MSEMFEAIAAHRAAWQAFQDAPYGPKGSAAFKEAQRAEDEECDAMFALQNTIPASTEDLIALKAHLDWYVAEENQRRKHDPALFALHSAIDLALALGWRDCEQWFAGADALRKAMSEEQS